MSAFEPGTLELLRKERIRLLRGSCVGKAGPLTSFINMFGSAQRMQRENEESVICVSFGMQ